MRFRSSLAALFAVAAAACTAESGSPLAAPADAASTTESTAPEGKGSTIPAVIPPPAEPTPPPPPPAPLPPPPGKGSTIPVV